MLEAVVQRTIRRMIQQQEWRTHLARLFAPGALMKYMAMLSSTCRARHVDVRGHNGHSSCICHAGLHEVSVRGWNLGGVMHAVQSLMLAVAL